MVGCFRWEEEEVVIKFEEMVDGEIRTLNTADSNKSYQITYINFH